MREDHPQSETVSHVLAVEINDFMSSGRASPRSRSRVIPNILHLLDHMDKHRAEGNFFITPDIMEDFPEVVSLVASRGHEIGLCCDYRNSGCPASLISFKDELEKLIGRKSSGCMLKCGANEGPFRLKNLAVTGFSYVLPDFNPVSHHYPPRPFNAVFGEGLSMMVFPVSYYSVLGVRVLFGMAGKLRLYPYWFLRFCIRFYGARGIPAVINFPLWEFDPYLPRQALSFLDRLRSYGNLSLAELKLTRLLLEFDFGRVNHLTVSEVYKSQKQST